jgi:hypothetical protein
MKKIISFLIIIGMILIIINIMKKYTIINYCPKPVIKYVYVNRDFKEEQENPYYVSEIMDNLFSNKSIWSNSMQLYKKEKSFD